MQSDRKIVVMGAGAVGSYFGAMLARAGVPVTLIAREAHVAAINRNGLVLDGLHVREAVRVNASADVGAARGAHVALLCVKAPDTETAARELSPHLAPDAVIVSLQNGVDNVERIRAVTNHPALAAVVYVAAEMTAPGRVRHTGRGDLVIGDPADGDEMRPVLDELAALFERADVPCRVSDNINGELWVKFVINCAYNAVSALTRAPYGRLAENAFVWPVMLQVIGEVVALANAASIRLPDVDLVEAARALARAMEMATSSTAQDIARGKHTEIDALNGYVVRRGAELGIPTPINQTLHALVKMLEEVAFRS